MEEVLERLQDLKIRPRIEFSSYAGKTLKLNTASDVQEIIDALNKEIEASNSNKEHKERPLVHIKLSGNTIGVEAARELANALSQITNLHVVDLSDIFTGRLMGEVPQALAYLCDALENKEYLYEVNLSHNAFGPSGTQAFAKLLKTNHNIRVLKVINNGLGIGGGTIISEALQTESDINGVKSLPKISVFEAGRNRLENAGALKLSEAFKLIGTLISLHLPQNGIRPDGIIALSDAISVNAENFTDLNLSDNTLKIEGATAVANAIRNMKKLKHLNLGDCLLGTEGGIIIAEAIQEAHDELEYLDLIFNEMGDKAAFAIAKAIKNKKSLKRLELNGNEFSAKGIAAIKEALNGKVDDVLGTLSDNEGEEEEEEEEHDK
jgi:Ran GTPase-activating protein 1